MGTEAPIHHKALFYDTDFDINIGLRVVSDTNTMCAILIKHKTLTVKSVCLLP